MNKLNSDVPVGKPGDKPEYNFQEYTVGCTSCALLRSPQSRHSVLVYGDVFSQSK